MADLYTLEAEGRKWEPLTWYELRDAIARLRVKGVYDWVVRGYNHG